MRHLLLLLLVIMLSSFSFENFNFKHLEEDSILFHSEQLAKNYSGKKIQW